MRLSILFTLIALIASTPPVPAGQAATTARGPDRGSLVLKGGVGPTPAIDAAFAALAGGPTARVVVIPTASIPMGDVLPPGMLDHLAQRMKESFGVASVTVLQPDSRARADSDAFAAPLTTANGVWFLGGFPPQLVEALLGTKTEAALRALLNRGGVIGGESAGAMILGSWLDVDEDFTPEIRKIMQAHPAGQAFGFFAPAAIFPHFDSRGPESAIAESTAHPNQLAVGIDNAAALVVRGSQLEAVGQGTISLYNAYNARGAGAANVVVLKSGDKYDLAAGRKPE